MTILITGGNGFIGSNFTNYWLSKKNELLVNIDKLTYSSKNNHIQKKIKSKNYKFFKISINDKKIYQIIYKYKPRVIINFAAETHVDNSIKDSSVFFRTNVMGTLNLLNQIKKYYFKLKTKDFLFIHFSTDEVFGHLGKKEKPFSEKNNYNPRNPYSASKASSDHIVKSFYNTFKIPSIVLNCSNNFGPYQNSEKLIPLTIKKIFYNQRIPIYGDGLQIRDWLFVEDNCKAILKVIEKGNAGETYNIGGNNEIRNIDLVKLIINEYALINKIKNIKSLYNLINFVKDRPGHDIRYAINISKIKKNLNWSPTQSNKFYLNIRKTIKWYMNNKKYL